MSPGTGETPKSLLLPVSGIEESSKGPLYPASNTEEESTGTSNKSSIIEIVSCEAVLL